MFTHHNITKTISRTSYNGIKEYKNSDRTIDYNYLSTRGYINYFLCKNGFKFLKTVNSSQEFIDIKFGSGHPTVQSKFVLYE